MAEGQGGCDVEVQDQPNIFEKIRLMGNSTVVTENQVTMQDFAQSLQTLTCTMNEMKRDINSLKSGSSSSQSEASIAKRARISRESDFSSDDEERINSYLDSCQEEAPEGENSEWLDINDHFMDNEETGDDITPELAQLTNKVLRSRPKEDKSKSLTTRHKRPKNVENLQIQKVNEQLWRQLKKDTKSFDFAMQRSQLSLCQALVPILKMMELFKGQHISQEIKELTGDTFKILAQAVVNSNDARKERIKRDLLPSYRPLCANQPSATKLFGDKIQEDISSLKESKTNLTTNVPHKKPFLFRRGGPQNRQTYNPAFPSHRVPKNQGNYNQFRNQRSTKREKPQK